MSTGRGLSGITIGFHWLLASAIIILLVMGSYMSWTQTWSLFHLHKSIGIVVLIAAVARILWRVREGWPVPAGDYTPLERFLSKASHRVLLAATIIMPISGMIYSGAGGHGFGIGPFTILPRNHSPANPAEVVAYSEQASALGLLAHQVSAAVLVIVLILHVAGALKHHFVDRDRTLKRMLGRGSAA